MSDDDGPTASLIIFFLLLITEIFFYGFGAAYRIADIRTSQAAACAEIYRKQLQ